MVVLVIKVDIRLHLIDKHIYKSSAFWCWSVSFSVHIDHLDWHAIYLCLIMKEKFSMTRCRFLCWRFCYSCWFRSHSYQCRDCSNRRFRRSRFLRPPSYRRRLRNHRQFRDLHNKIKMLMYRRVDFSGSRIFSPKNNVDVRMVGFFRWPKTQRQAWTTKYLG